MITFIERLAKDCLQDEYFISLQSRLDMQTKLTEKEFYDTLRFADIFSNAEDTQAQETAYKLIKSLDKDYNTNFYYQTFSQSVLTKINKRI